MHDEFLCGVLIGVLRISTKGQGDTLPFERCLRTPPTPPPPPSPCLKNVEKCRVFIETLVWIKETGMYILIL